MGGNEARHLISSFTQTQAHILTYTHMHTHAHTNIHADPSTYSHMHAHMYITSFTQKH